MTTASIETSFKLIPKRSKSIDWSINPLNTTRILSHPLYFPCTSTCFSNWIFEKRLNMGTIHTVVFCSCIILVLLPWSVTSNFTLAPIFSPIFDDLCKHVECGKGTCKASNNSLDYVCDCEPGWLQTRPAHNDNLKFLPCVIPNCTLDFSCANASPPAPAKEKRTNDSFLEPCHWADCGGGTCNKTSAFTHKCECNEGYFNLLNVTAFPCLKECALGADCSTLGIDVMNRSSPSPGLPDNSNNQASSTSINDLNWKILISLALAFVLLK